LGRFAGGDPDNSFCGSMNYFAPLQTQIWLTPTQVRAICSDKELAARVNRTAIRLGELLEQAQVAGQR
jgi:hypothetical protein